MTNCARRPPLDKDHVTDGLGAGGGGPTWTAALAKQVWRRCGAWRGVLGSATVEERPNEVPRDGAHESSRARLQTPPKNARQRIEDVAGV